MYKKLHFCLTLFFTLAAGAILIMMSLSYVYMSEKEQEKNNFLTFRSNVSAFISNSEQQNDLSWEWLSKTAFRQTDAIMLYDNGMPITYNRIVHSETVRSLADDIMSYAKNVYPNIENSSRYGAVHQEFSWTSVYGEDYYAAIICIRRDYGAITGVILSPKTPFKNQIKKQRIRFLLLNVTGLFVLLLFSYYYTGWLLAPIMESRKKQTAFVAAASHELRTPIAVICSAVSAAKAANWQQKGHFLHIIEEESKRLSILAGDLMLLNHADTERFLLNLETVELDTLLLNAYESFEPLARERQMNLKIVLPEEPLCCCTCDGKRISQVLGILISNALSYGSTDGYVKLSLSFHHPFFQIAVEDNGIGIADKDKPFIFDRFYRADPSRFGKDHFGLGLCIAKEIITAHGGKIVVADTPGGGARFFILLKRI